MLAALAVGRSLLKRYLPLQQTESSSNVKRQRIMVTENGSGDCQMRKEKKKMKITVDKAPTQPPSPAVTAITEKTTTPPSPPDSEKSTDIDLTKLIKTEEIKLGNKLRYQIFVPDVIDVQCEKLNNSVRVSFGSKQKEFCKTHQKNRRDYYFIDIEAANTADIDDVIVHKTRRKSFEIEYCFKPGKAPIPPAPTPPPPPAPTPPPPPPPPATVDMSGKKTAKIAETSKRSQTRALWLHWPDQRGQHVFHGFGAPVPR